MRHSIVATLTAMSIVLSAAYSIADASAPVQANVPVLDIVATPVSTSSDVENISEISEKAIDSTDRDLILLPNGIIGNIGSTVYVQEQRSGLLGLGPSTTTTTIMNGPATSIVSPVAYGGGIPMGGPIIQNQHYSSRTQSYNNNHKQNKHRQNKNNNHYNNNNRPRRLEEDGPTAASEIVGHTVSSSLPAAAPPSPPLGGERKKNTENGKQFSDKHQNNKKGKKNFLKNPNTSHEHVHNFVDIDDSFKADSHSELVWIPVPINSIPEWMSSFYNATKVFDGNDYRRDYQNGHQDLVRHSSFDKPLSSPIAETELPAIDEAEKSSIFNDTSVSLQEQSTSPSVNVEEIPAVESTVKETFADHDGQF